MRNLKLALFLTAFYALAEAIGGWLANSLALLADAGHMLTDAAALSLTLGAIWFAARPASPRKTYGYHRLEILAAFINALVLIILSLWVIYEAWERWTHPPEVRGMTMTLVAVGGLIVNLICAWLLHSDQERDLNLRGAWLHVVGDALGSVAAIGAGLLILNFGWTWADAVSSVLISLIIIYGCWNLISETVNVLLEGTPAHINLAAVEEAILQTDGVTAVHDLHVWTITSGLDALSAHVRHDETTPPAEVLRKLRKKLHDEFEIEHLTIQTETPDFADEDDAPCHAGTNCFESEKAVKAISR